MADMPSRLPDARIDDAHDPGVALRAMTARDLPRIEAWLDAPHVARWWDQPAELATITGHLDSKIVAPFLTEAEGQPIGYLQIYHANVDSYWDAKDLPRETFGIDLFIGEPDRIGQGWGPRFIGLALRRLFAIPQVQRIHVDPSPDNEAAIRAYAKVGFRRIGPLHTPEGRALYMIAERPRR